MQSTKTKSVLISGAGRGLGWAMAHAFHQAGYDVIVSDIDEELLDDYKNKSRFTLLQLDVSSEKDCVRCAEFLKTRFDPIDTIISNAGIFDFYAVSEAGSEKLKKIFDVNVFGLANLSKYFVPLFPKSHGRFIVISSESHKVPAPFQPYAVSKQALEKVYDAIRFELLTRDIKPILIRPGAMNTKILEQTIQFLNPVEKSKLKKEFANFLKSVPKYIQKPTDPKKVAQLVLKAADSKNPKRVYSINHNPLVSILSYIPEVLKQKLVVNSLKGK